MTFADGEVMEGSYMEYDPSAQGFFMFPSDANSNNERVYVVNASVRQVQRLTGGGWERISQ